MSLRICYESRKNRDRIDKPNEDCSFPNDEASLQSAKRTGVLIVADGVSRTPQTDSEYPVSSELASKALVRVCSEKLRQNGPPIDIIRKSMEAANAAILELNRECSILTDVNCRDVDLLGTTGTVCVVREGSAHFGHIGDTIGFVLRSNGEAELCTEDQVSRSHDVRDWVRREKMCFLEENVWKGLWKREGPSVSRLMFRNNSVLYDRDGRQVGYGVLTGEPTALDFVTCRSVELYPGDRIVLMSDGFDVLLDSDREPHEANEYAGLLPNDSDLNEEIIGQMAQLIDRAEQAEEEKQVRSDDKTMLIACYEG